MKNKYSDSCKELGFYLARPFTYFLLLKLPPPSPGVPISHGYLIGQFCNDIFICHRIGTDRVVYDHPEHIMPKNHRRGFNTKIKGMAYFKTIYRLRQDDICMGNNECTWTNEG
jgi:hypothetical protein